MGYLIGQDQYFKRDDVGIVYQINVVPEYRRSLVAAMLLKAQFERSAYGCKLYCCWCAQDIEANQFWEAMGFVPLAFRAGSEKKARAHIFWQKRIRAGDETTPWWFPSKTAGGAIGEDRIVLPIPPGVGWREVMPVILPGERTGGDTGKNDCATKEQGGETDRNVCPTGERKHGRARRGMGKKSPKDSGSSFSLQPSSLPRPVQFGPPGVEPVTAVNEGQQASELATTTPEGKAKPKRERRKCDPRMVTAARELRDRWLDEVNAGRYLPAVANAKYDVTRMIGQGRQDVLSSPMLDAA